MKDKNKYLTIGEILLALLLSFFGFLLVPLAFVSAIVALIAALIVCIVPDIMKIKVIGRKNGN